MFALILVNTAIRLRLDGGKNNYVRIVLNRIEYKTRIQLLEELIPKMTHMDDVKILDREKASLEKGLQQLLERDPKPKQGCKW